MAGKDEVNPGMDKPALKNSSHTFTFHVVGHITTVERYMHENNKPRCLFPIHIF